MEDKSLSLALTQSYIPLAAFVSGIAVGATTLWVILNGLQKSKPSVPVVDPKPSKLDPKDVPEEEEEDEEDDSDFDSDDEMTEEEYNSPSNKPHKMLLVIRTDLKMKPGKVAAQVGHATLGAYKSAHKSNPLSLKYWSFHGQAKVAVKASSEAEMDEIKNKAMEAGINTHVVCDAGKTQIAAGSRTVLALGPAPIEEIDKIASHLKLY